MIENRTLLQKADLALSELTSSGGVLQPEQAAKFIRILIEEAVLMQDVTVTPMKAPKKLIEKIRFSSRILRPGASQQALAAADRAKPNLGKVELDAKLFKAEVRIDDETMEDSIERGELRQTIMEEMGAAISRDMEEVIIKGDTASADLFLAQLDGVLKQAVSHVVAAGSVKLGKTVLRDLYKALPKEFRRNKKALAFYTASDAEVDFRDSLADRMGAAGDKYLEQDVDALWGGIPVKDVPMFPDDQGGGSDETSVLLTDPKNINVGIWRQIRIKTDQNIQEGSTSFVASLRFDAKFAEEDAVAKATAVKAAS
jgi:HK97 family phage major capsid protein